MFWTGRAADPRIASGVESVTWESQRVRRRHQARRASSRHSSGGSVSLYASGRSSSPWHRSDIPCGMHADAEPTSPTDQASPEPVTGGVVAAYHDDHFVPSS